MTSLSVSASINPCVISFGTIVDITVKLKRSVKEIRPLEVVHLKKDESGETVEPERLKGSGGCW